MADTEKIYQSIVDKAYTTTTAAKLNALFIHNCNGSGPNPFPRATISYVQSNVNHNFAVWFDSGFFGIAHAFKGNYTFLGKTTFGNMLRTVFSETEHLNCLLSVLHSSHGNSEAKIRNTLAVHYFQPLVYGGECFIDKGGLDICEFCKKKIDVKDTSLGNPKIWHGRADILIKNSAVKVECETCSDDLASGEPAAKRRKVEDHLDSEYSSDIEDELERKVSSYAIEQALAEGIVNAFCEAKRNKSFFKKFIPSFLATEKTIRIILYNCECDILLMSDPLPIWKATLTEDDEETLELDVDTLLQVWLALNFDSFDMEVDKEIMKRAQRAYFKEAVGEDAYRLYLTRTSKPCKSINERKEGLPVQENDDTLFVVTEIQRKQYFRIKTVLNKKTADLQV